MTTPTCRGVADVGGVVRRARCKRMDADLAIIDKRRRANVAEVMNISAKSKAATCVIMET